jgi:hypothetical protein
VFNRLKKNSGPNEASSVLNDRRGRAIPVAVLLIFVVLLSMVSGIYATASYFAQQASNITVTTTLYTTTTSRVTSTIWSTVTSTVLGVWTTVQYTTSTSTVTVTGSTTGGTSVIIDSYSETHRNNQQGIRGSGSGPMESGEAIPSHAAAFTISSIKFDLAKVGSPSGLIYANVYACTGTPGSTGIPTGASLGTSIGIDASTLSTSWTLVEFTFATPVSIAAGANYCISASYSGGNGIYTVYTGLDGISPSHPGNWFVNGWRAIPSYDMIFYVYGNWA